MLNRIDLRGISVIPRGLLPRATCDVAEAVETIRPVVEAVRDHGVEAIVEATHRFDGILTTQLRVPPEELRRAEETMDPSVRVALLEAINRARAVHSDQRRAEVTTIVVPGGTVTQRWLPMRRVGLYVPGGLAVYPSSVIMNVIPAQVAGVASVAVTSPPCRGTGLPHPLVMATCHLLGVDEVYAVGGAQAIAMLGYGAEGHCQPVDIITGPGNIWVTAAKRLLTGTVGIDAEAGPTEIAILADDQADARYIAADMISQAEHDPMAASVLITPSSALIEAVEDELTRRIPTTRHADRVGIALAGTQSAAVVVDDLEAGLQVIDMYAAEHVEIHTREARAVAERISHAGAIFVGPWSPVSLGDYCAGSNHVLPTARSARYSSGLSVQTFLRGVQIIEYDKAALDEVRGHVAVLASAENLPAHGEAVGARFEI